LAMQSVFGLYLRIRRGRENVRHRVAPRAGRGRVDLADDLEARHRVLAYRGEVLKDTAELQIGGAGNRNQQKQHGRECRAESGADPQVVDETHPCAPSEQILLCPDYLRLLTIEDDERSL